MELYKMVVGVSTQSSQMIDYGFKSFRAQIRDTYANYKNRAFVLDRMAITDFDLGYKVVGRIEVVEKFALQARKLPSHFILTKEEQEYADWLREVVNGESGNILLRDLFFHGVPDETSIFLRGEVA